MERGAGGTSLPAFRRSPLPRRFFNFDRLVGTLEARRLDGLVASSMYDVFYLTGFNAMAHKADEPRPVALVMSRREPEHPILLVADYYLSHFLHQPTWVEDIRPYGGVMLPLDIPVGPSAIDWFIPEFGREVGWVQQARRLYGANLIEGCTAALRDLGLLRGRVGFDDLRLASVLAVRGMEAVDAYGPLMFVRQVKTEEEVRLLREATRLNQTAIEQTVRAWGRGMTWQELNHAYHRAVVDLGGHIHDPGALVFANPRGADPVVTLQTGFEDFVIEPGVHVMFDCHGTWNLYCWDGGKTWVVADEPRGPAARVASATAEAMREIERAMRPGARISGLQATGRRVFQRFGVPRPESAVIFFHGLGLSHMDLEQWSEEGKANHDWALEQGMVVAAHLLYPGGDRHRMWLEDIALVTNEGGESLFTWGFDPMTNG